MICSAQILVSSWKQHRWRLQSFYYFYYVDSMEVSNSIALMVVTMVFKIIANKRKSTLTLLDLTSEQLVQPGMDKACIP